MSDGCLFIRHDAHRSPLQPPYDGPFRVLEAGPKSFVVDMGGSPERVSVDHLKLAHMVMDELLELAPPLRCVRSPYSATVSRLSPFPVSDCAADSASKRTPPQRRTLAPVPHPSLVTVKRSLSVRVIKPPHKGLNCLVACVVCLVFVFFFLFPLLDHSYIYIYIYMCVVCVCVYTYALKVTFLNKKKSLCLLKRAYGRARE